MTSARIPGADGSVHMTRKDMRDRSGGWTGITHRIADVRTLDQRLAQEQPGLRVYLLRVARPFNLLPQRVNLRHPLEMHAHVCRQNRLHQQVPKLGARAAGGGVGRAAVC